MIALVCFVLAVLASPLKSESRLEAENAALRQQLIVLRRKVRGNHPASTAGSELAMFKRDGTILRTLACQSLRRGFGCDAGRTILRCGDATGGRSSFG